MQFLKKMKGFFLNLDTYVEEMHLSIMFLTFPCTMMARENNGLKKKKFNVTSVGGGGERWTFPPIRVSLDVFILLRTNLIFICHHWNLWDLHFISFITV